MQRWRSYALSGALVAILVTDVVVLAGSTAGSAAPTPVEVAGHVVERSTTVPRLTARRATAPTRPPVGSGQPPPSFWSGERPPPPPPATVQQAPAWLEQRGAEALARISYPWRELGFTIDFRPARRGLRAVTYTRERRIVVFARRDDPVAQTAFDLAHELGHAFDVVHGNRPRRRRWLELRGLDPDTSWFGCSGCDDLATGSGDLAEVFALWQVGPVDFASRLAPAPRGAQLADLIRLFDPGWTSRDDPTRDGDADPADRPDEHASEEPRDESGQRADRDDDGSAQGDGEPDGEEAGEEDTDDEQEDDGGPLPCPVVCGRY